MNLELETREFLNFGDVGVVGPWIDVLTFRVHGSGDDAAVLAELLASRWYDYSYAEPRRGRPSARSGVHGPYVLASITPETFASTGREDARARVLAWADVPTGSPEDFSARFRGLLNAAFDGSGPLYELPDIRESAEHSWGFVVGGDGFLEYVSISENRDSVVLLVASDD